MPRVRRPDPAHGDSVRTAGAGVRVPLLRDPRDVERGQRARGGRRGGAHPCAGAARGDRAHARSGAGSSAVGRYVRGRASSPRRLGIGLRAQRQRSRAGAGDDLPAAAAWREVDDLGRPADRDHQGGGAALALLRHRQPVCLAGRAVRRMAPARRAAAADAAAARSLRHRRSRCRRRCPPPDPEPPVPCRHRRSPPPVPPPGCRSPRRPGGRCRHCRGSAPAACRGRRCAAVVVPA